MSSYYHYEEELIGVGMQLGEIALYAGTILRDGLRDGPSPCGPRNVFVFSREEEGILDLDLQFWDNTLKVSVHEDYYVFLRNEQGDFIQQISGPAKPVIVANIGAKAIRVNTLLGKYLIPAGAMFRLDRDTPLQRERKKVLLTFSDEAEQTQFLQSALMLDGGRWKPLNICADMDKVKVRDGSFTVQTLTLRSRGDNDVKLEDPPVESDYEVYFRSMTDWFEVRFAGVGMKDEGLGRKHHTFSPIQNKIYDFQRLRQAPATKLMHQCTARLPGLEELDGRFEDGRKEKAPAKSSALRKFLDYAPDDADTPEVK